MLRAASVIVFICVISIKEITFPKMVANCCRFLCYFCRISRQNQKAMFDHLSYLLENSSVGLGKSSTCSSSTNIYQSHRSHGFCCRLLNGCWMMLWVGTRLWNLYKMCHVSQCHTVIFVYADVRFANVFLCSQILLVTHLIYSTKDRMKFRQIL